MTVHLGVSPSTHPRFGSGLGTMCSDKYPAYLSLTDGANSPETLNVLGLSHNPSHSQHNWEENMAFWVISECQKLSPGDPCFFPSSPAPPQLKDEVL